jgi:hypothetical protein
MRGIREEQGSKVLYVSASLAKRIIVPFVSHPVLASYRHFAFTVVTAEKTSETTFNPLRLEGQVLMRLCGLSSLPLVKRSVDDGHAATATGRAQPGD